jgi:hypothetical protein
MIWKLPWPFRQLHVDMQHDKRWYQSANGETRLPPRFRLPLEASVRGVGWLQQ